MSDVSHDARTGTVVARIPTSTADQVRDVVARAAAAAPGVAAATPAERRRWLVAVADALEDPQAADELVRIADRETALGEARLTSELVRCAGQLRFYGDVGAEASYLRVTVDHAKDTTPDLRRMQVPLGPVAVLGASNFPFAFGALGNDTGSALAAGCPVVAKAHPAHPETSAVLATIASAALAAAGAPEGAFGLVAGFEAGEVSGARPRCRRCRVHRFPARWTGVVATGDPARGGHPRVRRNGHREPGRDDHRRRGTGPRRSPPGSSAPSPSAPASSAPSRGSSSLPPATTSRPASHLPC